LFATEHNITVFAAENKDLDGIYGINTTFCPDSGFFFCFQIALFLEALVLWVYYIAKLDKNQTKRQICKM
jgi:hypothetical protein